MLNFSQGIKLWLFIAPCDMRKQMDSLLTVVASKLGRPAVAGNLYVFLNRRRTYARVLFLDATGTCLFSKRFFEGSVGSRWATGLDLQAESVEIPSAVLAEILAGGQALRRDIAA
jgi:transposase